MGLCRWLGLTTQSIDVQPVERALLQPKLSPDHPDAVAEFEALVEARRLMAGRPLHQEEFHEVG